jgi:hypothetical protein
VAQLASGSQPIPCESSLQSLEFPIPRNSHLRRFDQIRVTFQADEIRAEIGPRIALRQFEFTPR